MTKNKQLKLCARKWHGCLTQDQVSHLACSSNWAYGSAIPQVCPYFADHIEGIRMPSIPFHMIIVSVGPFVPWIWNTWITLDSESAEESVTFTSSPDTTGNPFWEAFWSQGRYRKVILIFSPETTLISQRVGGFLQVASLGPRAPLDRRCT